MRTKILTSVAATAIAMVSTNAYAAANLTNVSIQGLGSPYSWNTAMGSMDTVFIQQPLGNIFNPNSEAINDPTSAGLNSFTINGEGLPVDSVLEAAQNYLITLTFADDATVSGIYNTLAPSDTFKGTTFDTGTTVYELTGFAWNRTLSDNVSAKQAVSGGSKADYAGQFSFTAVESAVPEPATWLMMLAGFGMVGAGLRSRKVRTSVTYA
ncbi:MULTISPECIES: PEPxxWA-CTERM sorting domain-containing protein [unclassified Sphingomonas]|uniref:PEPxxWA-CTERM sorting domain-containing protein n=1 Tax=unclassified Sphingomonas TaxID=196159 RepID=UPI001F5758A5|nr:MULTISPECIES: PEPxxWA-CTERM sorting domain-containing protein [unclassified Sphingomonas]